MNKKEIMEIIKQIDYSGDGFISFDEFEKMMLGFISPHGSPQKNLFA